MVQIFLNSSVQATFTGRARSVTTGHVMGHTSFRDRIVVRLVRPLRHSMDIWTRLRVKEVAKMYWRTGQRSTTNKMRKRSCVGVNRVSARMTLGWPHLMMVVRWHTKTLSIGVTCRTIGLLIKKKISVANQLIVAEAYLYKIDVLYIHERSKPSQSTFTSLM